MYRVLQSGLIHLFVGKNRKRFSIHKALENSFPRKALEPAMIENIDEEFFGCCCEFVYSRDYSAPSPILESSGNDDSQPKDMEMHRLKEAKRWDPSNLARNLFYPKVLTLNYGILLERLGHAPQSEFERLQQ